MAEQKKSPDTERVLLVLKHHGASKADFFDDISIYPQLWNEWQRRGIPSKKIKKIADYLRVEWAWIATGDKKYRPEWLDDSPRASGSHKIQKRAFSVPILTLAQAAEYSKHQNHEIFEKAEDWVDTTKKISENGFALRVASAQNSISHPKTIVYFLEPDYKPENGDIVAVYNAGSEEASLKTIFIDGPYKLLKSLNPEIPNQAMDENWTIFGVVIEANHKYR